MTHWAALRLTYGRSVSGRHSTLALASGSFVVALLGFVATASWSQGYGGLPDGELAAGVERAFDEVPRALLSPAKDLLEIDADSLTFEINSTGVTGASVINRTLDVTVSASRNGARLFAYGVPLRAGRNEIDDSQELDYPTLMKAIVATGYKAYVGQEFIPKREDALNSLKQAYHLCNV